MLIGWFFYTKYIHYTFKEIENRVVKQLDTIQVLTKSPQKAMEEDCTFDLDTQTDDFLKSIPEFSNYTWNNDKKQATIVLENNDTLLVQRGGCNHFVFSATLILQKSDLKVENQKEIFEKALWMAEKLYEKSDYMYFQTAISIGEYDMEKHENEFLLTFPSENYCGADLFFIRNPKTQQVEIKIGYYLC